MSLVITLNQLKDAVMEDKHRAKDVSKALDNWFNEYLETVKRWYTIPVADKISDNNQNYLIMTLLILLGWVNRKDWDLKIVLIALICLATVLLFSSHIVTIQTSMRKV